MDHSTCLGSAAVLAGIPGLTYRKLDHWTRNGYLVGHQHHVRSGSGVPTFWSVSEFVVAVRMAQLMGLGFNLAAAANMARDPARIEVVYAILADLVAVSQVL